MRRLSRSTSVACPCFNSRTLGRVRRRHHRADIKSTMFQFTHPGKGATHQHNELVKEFKGFNSRTLGRVRLPLTKCVPNNLLVSIHAPWEGCDYTRRICRGSRHCFNSRTLGRVRLPNAFARSTASKFQFTHPGKGATGCTSSVCRVIYVSIHAPWEGCDTPSLDINLISKHVSIHAPWEGCDIRRP